MKYHICSCSSMTPETFSAYYCINSIFRFNVESSEESSDDSDEDATSTKNKKKKQKVKKAKEDKPVFLKDYERKIITEKGGHYSDEEEDVEDRRDEWFERSASPTYVQEQDMIKKR